MIEDSFNGSSIVLAGLGFGSDGELHSAELTVSHRLPSLLQRQPPKRTESTGASLSSATNSEDVILACPSPDFSVCVAMEHDCQRTVPIADDADDGLVSNLPLQKHTVVASGPREATGPDTLVEWTDGVASKPGKARSTRRRRTESVNSQKKQGKITWRPAGRGELGWIMAVGGPTRR
jgi:hypothetical protein